MYLDSGLDILTLKLGYRKIQKTSSGQEVVLEGRVMSFNTWAREVEAKQESCRQSLDSDRWDLGQYRRVPRPSLRISALERRVLGEYRRAPRSPLRISALERRVLGEYIRIRRPSMRFSALERRVLGQYRGIPRPFLRISTLERRVLGQNRRVPRP